LNLCWRAPRAGPGRAHHFISIVQTTRARQGLNLCWRAPRAGPGRTHQKTQQNQPPVRMPLCSIRPEKAYKGRTRHTNPWRIRGVRCYGVSVLRVPSSIRGFDSVRPLQGLAEIVRSD
jgi:hypothetical protein